MNKIVLSLDAEQLRLLDIALRHLNQAAPDITCDPDNRPRMFAQLYEIVATAREACTRRDQAADADERLHRLLAGRQQWIEERPSEV